MHIEECHISSLKMSFKEINLYVNLSSVNAWRNIIFKIQATIAYFFTQQTFFAVCFCCVNIYITAQKMNFFINNLFSKCDQIRRKLRIWVHLLKNSTTESFTLRPPYLVNLHSEIVWTHSNSVVNVNILFLLKCSTFLCIMFYWIFLFLSKQECFTLKYKTSLVKVKTQEKRAKLFLPNRKSLE